LIDDTSIPLFSWNTLKKKTDQDKTLDELSNAISRQRDLSLHISSELEVQENLLDELDQDLDFTSTRLTRANKRMDSLFRKIAKDGACWTIFGLVAILLVCPP
jgi:syntaxin 8